MQKRGPIVLFGALAGALLPALLFGAVLLSSEGSAPETLFGFLWGWSALPGSLLAPNRGNFTFLVIVAFWLVLGALTAFVFTTPRHRHNIHGK
jgi:hypothetical protein